MFVLLLFVLLAAVAVHASRLDEATAERVGEISLLWLLAGYCGLPMLVVALASLIRPEAVAGILGFPAGNPFQDFMGVALLGMAVAATAALRFRGVYLVGPTLAWATFWLGATWIHVRDFGGLAGADPHALLHIFVSHGLVAVLLLAALAASGVARSSRAPPIGQ